MIIKARVPQTSANLGAGFDTLGLALSVYNHFSAEILENDNGIYFTGCKKEFQNEDNLLYKSIKYLFDKKGFNKQIGFKFHFDSYIKDGSGLGSSATCIVAGLLIGAKLLEDYNIFVSKDEIVKYAIDIEGHGDNVVPAILGGLTAVMSGDKKHFVRKVSVSSDLKFATLTSNLEKESTNKLREALKTEISLSDATFNISHSIMTMLSLEHGDKELLRESMKDKLHEQYRKVFIDDFDAIYNKALELCAISLNISGSGPSLLVIYDDDFLENDFIQFLKTLPNNWCFTKCNVDMEGATIEED